VTPEVIAALCTGAAGIITALGTAAALVIHARTPDAHPQADSQENSQAGAAGGA
jgi:hypothetical protein